MSSGRVLSRDHQQWIALLQAQQTLISEDEATTVDGGGQDRDRQSGIDPL